MTPHRPPDVSRKAFSEVLSKARGMRYLCSYPVGRSRYFRFKAESDGEAWKRGDSVEIAAPRRP
jgi:hypothetical protein